MDIRKLNEIREVRNLSYVSIAEQSGIPYRTVSKLFSGENQNPTWETITAIARVLDEEYHRFLEQMYREEKINAFNLVDDIRQLSYEQIVKASRYIRALKNGFTE